eukprot:CAMPEP_0170349680 /NCGR_PEP_ID=MMETSP0116_2-20130129/76127_1 /TAXON_ID=400756 /ORGANISM="Durinskia baltica, Strain CSIRO CS-38" /LENGTH=186 /DNA_ID=CAMNT_0010603557 /DNA_START=40 /DNA_END=596 /DNA_ORIENTATION=-
MTSSSTTTPSPWMYFLAGALLPTLAMLILRKNSSTKNPSTIESKHRRRKKEEEDGKNERQDNDHNEENESQDNDDDDDDDSGDEMAQVSRSSGPSSQWGRWDGPYKMILCVNQELSMGKGKVAAQCCHAAVGCYKRASKQCPVALRSWEVTGCAKIALKCPTEDELLSIATLALERDIPLYLVEDA